MSNNEGGSGIEMDEQAGGGEEQLLEDTDTPIGTSEAVAADRPQSGLKKNLPYIGAGLVVALFVGYKVMGMVGGKKNDIQNVAFAPSAAAPAKPASAEPPTFSLPAAAPSPIELQQQQALGLPPGNLSADPMRQASAVGVPPMVIPPAASAPILAPQPPMAMPAPAPVKAPVADPPQPIATPQQIETQVLAGSVPSETKNVSHLRNENRELRQKLARLEGENSDLRRKTANPHPVVTRTAARPAAQPVRTVVTDDEINVAPTRVAAKDDGRAGSNFRLHAIVTGRAWLQGPNNESLSVAVGDAVPDEGYVKVIDPEAGVVKTTRTVIR